MEFSANPRFNKHPWHIFGKVRDTVPFHLLQISKGGLVAVFSIVMMIAAWVSKRLFCSSKYRKVPQEEGGDLEASSLARASHCPSSRTTAVRRRRQPNGDK